LFRILGVKKKPPVAEVEQLLQQLSNSSLEIDKILSTLSNLAGERRNAIMELENQLAHLTSREEELREKVESLEKVPLPAAEHFAHLVELREKRNALRDYGLFLAGVLVSVFASILLKRYGLA
jgi:DNA repair exonuclease SbcCD ATPase subunit